MAMSLPAPETAPRETLSLEERIRRRAYELYMQRGHQSGRELDDWVQAEREILRAQESCGPLSNGEKE